jgi:hypothetical protein
VINENQINVYDDERRVISILKSKHTPVMLCWLDGEPLPTQLSRTEQSLLFPPHESVERTERKEKREREILENSSRAQKFHENKKDDRLLDVNKSDGTRGKYRRLPRCFMPTLPLPTLDI